MRELGKKGTQSYADPLQDAGSVKMRARLWNNGGGRYSFERNGNIEPVFARRRGALTIIA